MAFSPDGKTLAAGYGDMLRFGGPSAAWCCGTWPRGKRLVEEPLPVNEGDVRSVAFSPDGKTLAAGYGDVGGGGGVVLWDVASAERLAGGSPPREGGRRNSVAFSPDGKTLAAGYGVERQRRCGAVGRRFQILAVPPARSPIAISLRLSGTNISPTGPTARHSATSLCRQNSRRAEQPPVPLSGSREPAKDDRR